MRIRTPSRSRPVRHPHRHRSNSHSSVNTLSEYRHGVLQSTRTQLIALYARSQVLENLARCLPRPLEDRVRRLAIRNDGWTCVCRERFIQFSGTNMKAGAALLLRPNRPHRACTALYFRRERWLTLMTPAHWRASGMDPIDSARTKSVPFLADAVLPDEFSSFAVRIDKCEV